MRAIAVATLIILASIAPAYADEAIKPMKPDWCDNVDLEGGFKVSDSDAANKSFDEPIKAADRAVSSGYSEQALIRIAKTACVRPDDPNYQNAVARWRGGYVALIGLSEKQDREAQKARAAKDWEAQKKAYCDTVAPGDEASLEQKAMASAIAAGTGCAIGSQGGEVLDLQHSGWTGPAEGWWIDTRADVSSQIARAVFVTRCLRFVDDGKPWSDAKRSVVMAGYATCGPDARRLDAAALEKELTDKRFNGFAKVHARETFAQAKAVTDALTTEYKKLAKDANYQKLLFDAPEAGWAQWQKDYTANKDAFEAAKAYETAFYGPSKNALKGCGAKLRKGFATYIKSKKPKTADEARAAALDAFGYNLLASLVLCDGVEGRALDAKAGGELLHGEGKGAPAIRRGPRLEASYAAQRALGEILADRDKFPVKTGEFHADIFISPPDKDMLDGATDYYQNKVVSPGRDPSGTIEAVKKGVVSFKAVKTTVPNIICKPNNRIDHIASDGQVIYDKDCHREGNVTLTEVEKALTIGAEVADGLKAGQVGVFAGDESTPRGGFPKEIYGDKEMKKLLVWFGIVL